VTESILERSRSLFRDHTTPVRTECTDGGPESQEGEHGNENTQPATLSSLALLRRGARSLYVGDNLRIELIVAPCQQVFRF